MGISPSGFSSPEIEEKLGALMTRLTRFQTLLISYSGGVDSALLAVIAREVLGGRVSCAILDSPLLPRRALEEAVETAALIGIPCTVIPHPVLECRDFTRNSPERCYVCKKSGASLLKEVARVAGADVIADGLNHTDLEQHRPGIRASDEEGIIHPFVEAGITKEEIREIARVMRLSFWDKSSEACLASRIAYGKQITRDNLAMIEAAEKCLKNLGLTGIRVRIHGELARIEVPPTEIRLLIDHREFIVKYLVSLGFCYVTVDLEGLVSGSMDRILRHRAS